MRAQRYVLVFDAIRSILETSSIENLTIANIARVSDLHPNTINYYFNGKTDMLIRFHTYMSENERRELPEVYTTIPADTPGAVRALLRLVDCELFSSVNRPLSFQKIVVYLYGMMDIQPQIKCYLGEKQEERCAFLRSVLLRYCDAGVVRPEKLEEGLASLVTVGTGYSLISEYYNTPKIMRGMAGERERIVRLLLEKRLEAILAGYLSGL